MCIITNWVIAVTPAIQNTTCLHDPPKGIVQDKGNRMPSCTICVKFKFKIITAREQNHLENLCLCEGWTPWHISQGDLWTCYPSQDAPLQLCKIDSKNMNKSRPHQLINTLTSRFFQKIHKSHLRMARLLTLCASLLRNSTGRCGDWSSLSLSFLQVFYLWQLCFLFSSWPYWL